MSADKADLPQDTTDEPRLRRTGVAAPHPAFPVSVATTAVVAIAMVLGWYREPEPDRAPVLVGSER